MKTKNLTLAIVAFLFAANIFATETPKMKVVPIEENKVLIAVNHNGQIANKLSIYDQSGEIIYFKKLKKGDTGYQRIFNLEKVGDGKYEVRLQHGRTTTKKSITVNEGNVSLEQQQPEIPPVFTEVDEGINLTYLNFAKKDVTVSVYKSDQLLTTADLGSDFTIHKRINLTALNRGNYNILLACDNKEFWFSGNR